MKTYSKNLFITTLAVVILSVLHPNYGTAQFSSPPPPPPSKGESGNQGPSDGGAPIGEGSWALISFAICYGAYKLKLAQNKNQKITVSL